MAGEHIGADVRSRERGMHVVCGTFFPDGTNAIDNTTNIGAGFTVFRNGVGDFTVTLDEGYPELTAWNAFVSLATPADTVAQGGAITVSTTDTAPTLGLSILTAGAAADIAADPDNKVHLVLYLKSTTSDT